MSEEKEASKKAKASEDERSEPVHIIREGAIAASIWKRQSPSGYAYHDFTLSRSWKSVSTQRTGYSKSFFETNRQALIDVVTKTSLWIEARNEEQQAEAASGTLAA